ncbi:MAG: hypothetical protein ABI572_02450, partial [Actinomycetota bacterium]
PPPMKVSRSTTVWPPTVVLEPPPAAVGVVVGLGDVEVVGLVVGLGVIVIVVVPLTLTMGLPGLVVETANAPGIEKGSRPVKLITGDPLVGVGVGDSGEGTGSALIVGSAVVVSSPPPNTTFISR